MKLSASVDKQLDQVAKEMRAIAAKAAPKAMTSALNKVAGKAKTATVSAVAKEVGVRVKDVKPRVHLRKARWEDVNTYGSLRSILSAYVKPITAVSLLSGRKGGAGFFKRTKQTTKSGKAKKVNVGGSSKLGGMKVGKIFFPNAYIALVSPNQKVHILHRKQKATWASPGVRAPVDVARVPLQGAFDRHFYPIAKGLMKSDFDRIAKHEMKIYLDREIKNSI
jgi:hypothetical protein